MPNEAYAVGNNGGGQTQTLSRLSSERAEARKASLKSQALSDKNTADNHNANSVYRNAKRDSIISTGHVLGNGNSNSNKSIASLKDQRKSISLVRDGYSSLNLKPKAKPKAKIQPTLRESNVERDSAMGSNAVPSNSVDGDSIEDNGRANQIPHHNDDISNSSSHEVKGGRDVGRIQEPQSVRKRFYDTAVKEDVVQEKVATQLRENGIAETRVASLSAKISQAVRDDVIDATERSQPQVFSNLTNTIHNHLDVILHNYPQHTDLSNLKPHDATKISQIVLMRVAQIHNELDSCKQSLTAALKSSPRRAKANEPYGESTTLRDTEESQERSVVISIKEGIEVQKTETEILADKIKQLENDGSDVEKLRERNMLNIKTLDEENWQLKKCLQEADQDNEVLVAKVKDQDIQQEKLEKSLQAIQKETEQLKRQIGELKSQGRVTAKDLAALQSEKARLQVLCDQRQKEIIHLRDPDRDLLLQIRALKEEVTVLRTQSRRLGEERGLLRAKNQKMDSALDESLKTRNKLANERDTLFKENQELLQRYRKLSLSTPLQRTLPELLTPRNGLSTRSTSRSTLRPDSNILVLKNSFREESRLSTHKEEQEEEKQEITI